MSDTPRTDAEYSREVSLYPQSVTKQTVVNISFARQLERELSEAKAKIAKCIAYFEARNLGENAEILLRELKGASNE